MLTHGVLGFGGLELLNLLIVTDARRSVANFATAAVLRIACGAGVGISIWHVHERRSPRTSSIDA